MLVITRKLGEKVFITDDIWVEVVRINGDQVRLGITAPPQIQIYRDDCKTRPKPEREKRDGI